MSDERKPFYQQVEETGIDMAELRRRRAVAQETAGKDKKQRKPKKVAKKA